MAIRVPRMYATSTSLPNSVWKSINGARALVPVEPDMPMGLTRRNREGKGTQVLFRALPADIKVKYPGHAKYYLKSNQWWEAVSYGPISNMLGRYDTVSTTMRKATKEEVKYYRSPELTRFKF
tara:strand:- start:162676 stop:163044 length:369 start_codon:yes stop_codon:yes gene_type:complete